MRRRDVLRSSALFTVGAVSTSVLGSCGNKAAIQPTTVVPVKKAPLRIALIPWIGWGGAYIAEVKGFFKEEGIEVKQTVFQTVSEVNTALLSKQMDLSWLVATDLLVLAAKAPDLKFIYACDYSGEVDAIVSHGINAPADLKGKKIAREDIPYEVVFTNKYLESVGLTDKDVQIVSLAVPDAHAAFIAGKVDAATIYEPFVGKALKGRPGSKVLYTAKGSNTIANGLAADNSILKTRTADVLAYLRAFAKGMKYAADYPQEANGLIAKWVGATPAEVAAQMAQIRLLDMAANKSIVFDDTNPLNAINSIDSAAPILLKAGKISKVLAGKNLVDGSFVKAI
ncbi:ABC transporter substrate-binding protein [Chamaesiphon sp. VAR_48_metabat_403]|uniref:ABC transporter substrate-binding protein n=1 Tax=Chamaesiphon sp. VAR_48_metabat_403 TaxID=2964700 RepID=UPI00286E2CE2|nr:ABC transporter substrate-binding protein [Chamaesiphon sp. VAR_48_metabat_403]